MDIWEKIQTEYGTYCDEKSKIICEALGKRSGTIVWAQSIPSTNTVLLEYAKCGIARNGDVIAASAQTNGRGRLGRSFYSSENMGIYLSYLYIPKSVEAAENISCITSFASVYIRNAIMNTCGVDCEIKWVNDIVCGTRKICGILTEGIYNTAERKITGAVIGVGINVNQGKNDFPSELLDMATSVYAETGKKMDITELCAAVIAALDTMCVSFPNNKEAVKREFEKHCVNIGQKVRIVKNGGERMGVALGINDDFALTVRFDDGVTEDVFAGDVSVRGYYGYV